LEKGEKYKLILSLIKAMAKKSETQAKVKEYLDKYEREVGKRIMKRIYNIYLQDEQAYFWFMIDDNGMIDWGTKKNEHGHTTIYTDADTILALRNKKIKILDQKTGQIVSVPYTFMDACRMGKIKWSGVASTQDIKRFIDLLIKEPDLLNEVIP